MGDFSIICFLVFQKAIGVLQSHWAGKRKATQVTQLAQVNKSSVVAVVVGVLEWRLAVCCAHCWNAAVLVLQARGWCPARHAYLTRMRRVPMKCCRIMVSVSLSCSAIDVLAFFNRCLVGFYFTSASL